LPQQHETKVSVGGRQLGSHGTIQWLQGNCSLKDNLKNITEESVRLGRNAVSPGKRTLMFLLKRLDLITD